LRRQWLERRRGRAGGGGGGGKGAAGAEGVKARLRERLAKREKARDKVREELRNKQELPWRALGDWLKANQSLDVPREWEPFVDKRRKLAWNIEQAFVRARERDGKVHGTMQRLEILDAEIARLRALLEGSAESLPLEPEKAPPRRLKDLGAEGRTLHLSSDLMVVAGKSAADNLKLLRKARGWDLWLHLRDYPGAHAILFRNKSASVSDALLHQAAAWLVRRHLGGKPGRHAGARFDVVIAECRHVRPIKGDRLGRVTYRDERVLILKIPS
jgi:hypothetical protein